VLQKPGNRMTDKRQVQSFDRGLDVLVFLNRTNGASIGRIVAGTGINRGIVYRLLETLKAKGYIRKDKDSAKYWLTDNVHTLSDGFRNEAWIDRIAKPEIEELCRQLIWPVSLITLSGSSMQVRVTSDYVSPLVFDRFPTGFRFSVADSASGNAYIAMCSDQMRNTILSVVRSIEDAQGRTAAFDDEALERRLQKVREEGFALFRVQEKVNSFAVPIHFGDLVFGSLALRYFASALSRAAAIDKFFGPLNDCATRIARGVYNTYHLRQEA
jgi:IclR family mhp operon transcriptional activator